AGLPPSPRAMADRLRSRRAGARGMLQAESLRQLRVDGDDDEVHQLWRRHPVDLFAGGIQIVCVNDVEKTRTIQGGELLSKHVEIARADLERVEHRLGARIGRSFDPDETRGWSVADRWRLRSHVEAQRRPRPMQGAFEIHVRQAGGP